MLGHFCKKYKPKMGFVITREKECKMGGLSLFAIAVLSISEYVEAKCDKQKQCANHLTIILANEHSQMAAGERQNPMQRSDAPVGAESRMEKIEAVKPDGHTS